MVEGVDVEESFIVGQSRSIVRSYLEREREKQRMKNTERETQREKHTERNTERNRDKQRDKLTYTQKDRDREKIQKEPVRQRKMHIGG